MPDSTQPETWPDELDALVAAPQYHTLTFENDRVRVVITHVPPGHRTPVHTHRWPGMLHIVSRSDFVRYDDKGQVLVDTRKNNPSTPPSEFVWSAPLPPHSFENVGTTEFRAIAVELKDNTAS
jgi:hypothetical protein